MNKEINNWTDRVNKKITELLLSSVDRENHQIVKYQMSSGGKRIRPIVCLASCLATGGEIKDAIYPAAGLEILHNCTLIYDDIIDNGQIRRNLPTVWKKYGKSVAECIGLHYAAAIFQGANRSSASEKVSERMAIALKKVMDGQLLDMRFEQSGREQEPFIIKNRYRQVIVKDLSLIHISEPTRPY